MVLEKGEALRDPRCVSSDGPGAEKNWVKPTTQNGLSIEH